MDLELGKRLARLVPGQRIVYVDCGARAGAGPRWLTRALKDGRYVGFELDPQECEALRARHRHGHEYIAAALDAEPRRRTLYVTKSPACASLLEPDAGFVGQFAGLGDLFEVTLRREIETTTLDAALRQAGIDRVDVLELDTQGSELDILRGAGDALRSTVAVQAEVEFSAMYRGQPLFADIDAYLRARQFALFDLSRYHVRGAAAPLAETRGRLLWGHALYLRSDEALELDAAARLAFVAAAWGFPDHAAGVLLRLDRRMPADDDRRASLHKAIRALQAPAPSSVFARILRAAERRGFGRLVRSAGELAASAVNAVAAARHRDVWRS